jgi:type I restriction enzyme, R subunit
VLVKVPERVRKICEDIARHYQEKVAPNGFKGMVVTFDQECCLLYKAALDQLLPPEATEVVISATGGDERFKRSCWSWRGRWWRRSGSCRRRWRRTGARRR